MSRHSKKSKLRGNTIRAEQLEKMKTIGEPMAADKILKHIQGMSKLEQLEVNALDWAGKLKWFNHVLGNDKL